MAEASAVVLAVASAAATVAASEAPALDSEAASAEATVAMAAASAGRPEIFTLCAKKITFSSRGCCIVSKWSLFA